MDNCVRNSCPLGQEYTMPIPNRPNHDDLGLFGYLKEDADRLRILWNRAYDAAGRKEYAKALVELGTILSLRPDFVQAHSLICAISLLIGDYRTAMVYYRNVDILSGELGMTPLPDCFVEMVEHAFESEYAPVWADDEINTSEQVQDRDDLGLILVAVAVTAAVTLLAVWVWVEIVF